MDIQDMVDERLEKLRALQNRICLPEETETNEDMLHDRSSPHRRSFNAALKEQAITSSEKYQFSTIQELKFGDLIDAALNEVAERILMISDQVAGDYARMEKDILNSRLSVLQSAEKVLDIAISLRRKASSLNRTYQNGMNSNEMQECEMQLMEIGRMDEDSYTNDGRASMHDHGVASLFRRT